MKEAMTSLYNRDVLLAALINALKKYLICILLLSPCVYMPMLDKQKDVIFSKLISEH
jgi:hypothetical protein